MTARAFHPERSEGPLGQRFPKWNPRYVAYALSQGATPTHEGILEFREIFPDKASFIAWVAQQRETFRLEHSIRRHDLTRDQERAFERWIERRAVEVPSRG